MKFIRRVECFGPAAAGPEPLEVTDVTRHFRYAALGSRARRLVWVALLSVVALAACTRSGRSDEPKPKPTKPQPAAAVEPNPFDEMNGKKEYNASGVVALADGKFLFCDNNANDALFELDLTADGKKQGSLVRRPLEGLAPGAVDDMEGMALAESGGTRYVLVSTSMYVKERKKRDAEIPPSGLLRITIGADGSLRADNMAGIREWLVAAYPEIAKSAEDEPDEGGLNIEGLAWDPTRGALLFGVRTPAPEGKALVLPVRVKNIAGTWATENLEAMPAITLDLAQETKDDQGIRDLFYDAKRNAVLVLAGNATSNSEAPFSLDVWNGGESGKTLRLDVAFDKKMRPEGITRGTVGGRDAYVIVDDRGGFRVLWADEPPMQ